MSTSRSSRTGRNRIAGALGASMAKITKARGAFAIFQRNLISSSDRGGPRPVLTEAGVAGRAKPKSINAQVAGSGAAPSEIPERSSSQAFAKSVVWFSLQLTDGHSLRLRPEAPRASGTACEPSCAGSRPDEKGLSSDDGDRAASQRGDAARPGLARALRDRGLLSYRRRPGATCARAGAGRPRGQ